MKKLLALVLAVVMVLSLVACGEKPAETTAPVETNPAPETTAAPEAEVAELKSLANKEYGVDYVSLYSKFGKDVSIADVIEDPETGFAYIERDGVRYAEAIDPAHLGRVYTETTEPVEVAEVTS